MSTTKSIYNEQTIHEIVRRFLQALTGDEEAHLKPETFQIFPEGAEAVSADTKPQLMHHGSYDALREPLLSANASGYAVCMLINRGDQKGRKKENITAIRAFFIDDDDGSVGDTINDFHPPTIIVRTSRNRFHYYWVLKEEYNDDLSVFSKIQKALIEKFGTDPSVKDICRVMRIPGYANHKTEEFAELVKADGPKHDIATFRALLNSSTKKTRKSKTQTDLSNEIAANLPGKLKDAADLLPYIPADDYNTYITVGMALHNLFEGVEEGLNLFHQWAEKSSKYSVQDAEQKWNSFASDREDKVGYSTLLRFAKQHGYVPTLDSRFSRPSDDSDMLSYEEHIEFVQNLPGILTIRKCILTQDLMVLRESEGWINAINLIPFIMSYGCEFKGIGARRLGYHLERLRRESTPELLIDIPAWDGIDRVWEVCQTLRFSDFDEHEAYQLLMYVLAGLFRRLKDPNVQNPTLIIHGEQGVGKDTLVSALFGALGPYRKEIDLTHPEAPTQLHTVALCQITEFDRTSVSDIATLKHLLTASKITSRLKYDARAEDRDIRATFIATCNIEDILRDYTGNRRFWRMELVYGGFPRTPEGGFATVPDKTYPGMFARPNHAEERLQILAQAKDAADSGVNPPSGDVLRRMEQIIKRLTPPNPLVVAEQLWHELASSVAPRNTDYLTNAEIAEHKVLDHISNATGQKQYRIRSYLKRQGLEFRNGQTRGYRIIRSQNGS